MRVVDSSKVRPQFCIDIAGCHWCHVEAAPWGLAQTLGEEAFAVATRALRWKSVSALILTDPRFRKGVYQHVPERFNVYHHFFRWAIFALDLALALAMLPLLLPWYNTLSSPKIRLYFNSSN
ncbi:uncharacterized protein BKA55DRAFT_541481 [Fusarium redolens]|uniref:Uncharacterized protein n=1 Tax=Fusarium redolens TaxID=48865 RepID=A0A9P9GTV1_FUSRE|nr:uncharacterized protein BKA55DRAFT_541481 [Fusarium redolens]KAH7244583.1 hypothetical protein BKA55DRAFT_541481 [Fusarium redolens]